MPKSSLVSCSLLLFAATASTLTDAAGFAPWSKSLHACATSRQLKDIIRRDRIEPARVEESRKLTTLLYVAKIQSKIDFLGSLEQPYDLNTSNDASGRFLEILVKEVDSVLLIRDMTNFFQDTAPGRWRIVYAEKFSSLFGMLLGDVDQAELEIGNDESIMSCMRYHNPMLEQKGYLSLAGDYGTASNHLFVKVNKIQTKQLPNESSNDPLHRKAEDDRNSVVQTIAENFGPKMLAGVATVDIAFLDDDLIVFDFGFLGRAKGSRICARKEPAFF